ncbi:hypothetical protein BX616_008775 [Lobosporangium transversale]|uniref:Uncharacterized protein n=1 Tax=Lobosporangium transversale TaxID=64571 RepID=A0A1Y2GHC7_9FUNG|nr:hypothetical protein BCR41DRAFT_358248 [Lobosporangium transversale]KAF9918444.1 hypothetical protein BX616_008775 [Lobosporangium transversale]ORZ09663.1 hypothetical protein BCR41DRAFT_358248 [Lobosporangium transversale]|eukprot:XP_021878933.1 hypothetical protein BCR41DRAFT_358248 [Lobosporangium transversale]
MVDHSTSGSLQRQSGQQHHHPSYQYRQHYHQDIHGPLSASIVEGGHRPFAGFHGGPLHRPLHPASSNSISSTLAVTPLSSTSTSNDPSRPNISVSDILERYHDASKEFLISVLNAKAKEDERKAEEERYKTERIILQTKQIELDLAVEKRCGSPPAARPYHASASASSGHYPSTTSYYGSNNNSLYGSVGNNRPHSTGNSVTKHSHQDHVTAHPAQEPLDHISQPTHQSAAQYSRHDLRAMQPSPQSRPPSLKINTSVQQYHSPSQHPSQPQSQLQSSSQRQPSSPRSTLPPIHTGNPSSKASSSGRHYGLPSINSSAQSSPVAIMDHQSHVLPPLTPKDEHESPTSTLSPTSHLKRKSVNHDAVMDAVRAKVFRNASGQNQQQQQKKVVAAESERENAIRRKTTYVEKATETQKASGNAEQRLDERFTEIKVEGPSHSTLPLVASSPNSPSFGNSLTLGTAASIATVLESYGSDSRSGSPPAPKLHHSVSKLQSLQLSQVATTTSDMTEGTE